MMKSMIISWTHYERNYPLLFEWIHSIAISNFWQIFLNLRHLLMIGGRHIRAINKMKSRKLICSLKKNWRQYIWRIGSFTQIICYLKFQWNEWPFEKILYFHQYISSFSSATMQDFLHDKKLYQWYHLCY